MKPGQLGMENVSHVKSDTPSCSMRFAVNNLAALYSKSLQGLLPVIYACMT